MKTIVNIKTEIDLKRTAQKIAEELGLSLSAVINAYLKQFVRDGELRVSTAPQMNPQLEKLLDHVEYDMQRGRNLYGKIQSRKDLDAYFHSL